MRMPATSLIKQVAEHFPGPEWRNILDFIAYHASRDWWYLDSLSSSLEKLKFGTTTSLYMLGCAPRSDNPEYAFANAEAVEKIGIRSVIGVGPSRPPYPRDYTYWENGRRVDRMVSFEESLDKMEETIAIWKRRNSEHVQIWASTSRLLNENPNDPVYDPANARYIQPQADALQRVTQDYDVGFHLHGYGTAVKFMKERTPALLGPKTVIGHGWPLDLESVDILAERKPAWRTAPALSASTCRRDAARSPNWSRLASWLASVPTLSASIVIGISGRTSIGHRGFTGGSRTTRR